MRSRTRFGRSEAEVLAVQALTYLAVDESRLTRFFALTGLDPGTIRTAARSPGFLSAVLDHVAGDEALLLGVAQTNGVKPETIMAARQILAPSDCDE